MLDEGVERDPWAQAHAGCVTISISVLMGHLEQTSPRAML